MTIEGTVVLSPVGAVGELANFIYACMNKVL